MINRPWLAAVVVGALATASVLRAERPAASGPPAASVATAAGRWEQHHYSIAARVRPLLVFWISRSGVGDAIATRRIAPGEATYALLIGSDPERAPRRINRWGYIKEEIHGTDARLVGLMTQSDEDSLEQAEATINSQAHGDHPFKIIRATVEGERAESVVRSIGAPQDYTFRQLQTVLDLAFRESGNGKARAIRLPAGTRPGFLAALDDAMRRPDTAVAYVYYGRLYELRQTDARVIPNARSGGASFGQAIAAEFTITNKHNGEQSSFSMMYGTEGAYAQVPLTVSYRPRWWMEVKLTVDDTVDAAAFGGGVAR